MSLNSLALDKEKSRHKSTILSLTRREQPRRPAARFTYSIWSQSSLLASFQRHRSSHKLSLSSWFSTFSFQACSYLRRVSCSILCAWCEARLRKALMPFQTRNWWSCMLSTSSSGRFWSSQTCLCSQKAGSMSKITKLTSRKEKQLKELFITSESYTWTP